MRMRRRTKSMQATRTSEREQDKDRAHTTAHLYNGLSWRFALGLVCCFSISLFVCLKQNLSRQSLELAAIFDSGHYLYSSQQLMQLVQQRTALASADSVVHACKAMAEPVLLDGPILPVVTASFCLLLGKFPTVFDMTTPILLQAIIQALCATMVSVLAVRVMDGKWALAAGVLWGLYPPAVFAASKLLTEPISALLFVALVVTLAALFSGALANPQGKETSLKHVSVMRQTILTNNITIAVLALIAGVMIECLILLKPALLFGIIAMPLMTFLLVISFVDNASRAGAGPCLSRATPRVAPTHRYLANTILARKLNCPIEKLLCLGLCLVMGVALVFAPWSIFTRVATGQFLVMPRRMPVLNLLAGLNYESDGWECVPKAPLAALFNENENPLAVALGIFQANPGRSLDLFLSKPARLWARPYNDYGLRFFGLPWQLEQLWHTFIVMLGCSGLLLCLMKNRTDATNRLDLRIRKLICTLSIIIIGAHCAFLFFESTYRYAFTSMPFLLIFAVYGFKEMLGKRSSVLWASLTFLLFLLSFNLDSVPIILSFVQSIASVNSFDLYLRLLFLFVSFVTACIYFQQHDRRNKRWWLAYSLPVLVLFFSCSVFVLISSQRRVSDMREWTAVIRPGVEACRSIFLEDPAFAERKPDWALVLVDGDKSVSKGMFSVNGTILRQRAEPIYFFDSQRAAFRSFEIFAAAMRLEPSDFRQWRAVEVPVDLLKPGVSNEICLSASNADPVTIYGAYPHIADGQPLAPSLWDFAPKYLMNGGRSLEPRIRNTLPTKTELARCQWRIVGQPDDRDLSPAPGRQIGQYRMYLVLGYKSVESSTAKHSSTQYEHTTEFTEQIRSVSISPDAPYSWVVHLPKRNDGAHHFRVSISFDVSSLSIPSRLAYRAVVTDKSKTGYDLDFTEGETVEELNQCTQRCSLTRVVPMSGELSRYAVKLMFRAPRSEVTMDNLILRLSPANSPDFAGHRIDIF